MNYRSTSANVKTPPRGLGGVFDEGSANAVAEPNGLQTGLYPLVNIDHRVALVLDIARQLRGAFQDVGGVVGLADHEPALGVDAAHELQDRHLGLPLRVQLVRAPRVGLGLLAADTRTNAPLQHVLHYISFVFVPGPTALRRLITGVASSANLLASAGQVRVGKQSDWSRVSSEYMSRTTLLTKRRAGPTHEPPGYQACMMRGEMWPRRQVAIPA